MLNQHIKGVMTCLALTGLVSSAAGALTITLEPVDPPIIIPAAGGQFEYSVLVQNTASTPITFDVWTMAQLPDGAWFGPVLGPLRLTLAGGASLIRQRTQTIPGGAPGGTYTFEGRGGIFPDSIWASDSFPLVKLEAEPAMWTQTFGGSGGEVGESVQQTSDGGYIIAGITGSYGGGDNDYWLIKTDAAGDCTWSQTYGGSGTDCGRCAQQTQDGGYVIVGCSNSYSTGGNDYDVYLIKTDAVGNEVWNYSYGGLGGEFGEWVEQTQDGGYILTGQVYDYGAGGWDVCLIKTDENGSEQWSRTFGASYANCGESVRQTLDGGYIIGGWADYSYSGDIYLIKTDAEGNELWSHTYGGGGGDWGKEVQQTQEGGYVVAGWTSSFGAGEDDVYLLKTDGSGNELWSRTFGGTRGDWGNSVQQTQDGGYVVAGWTESFGAGECDAYIIRTDESGNELWNHTFGGFSDDYGNSVRQTFEGNYIIAGWTYSFGAGSSDVWLIGLEGEAQAKGIEIDFPREADMVEEPANQLIFRNHPNPFNSTTALYYELPQFSQVKLSIYDTSGCLVATLTNGWREAGGYEVSLNGAELPSGIYICHMEAGKSSGNLKIVLIK